MLHTGTWLWQPDKEGNIEMNQFRQRYGLVSVYTPVIYTSLFCGQLTYKQIKCPIPYYSSWVFFILLFSALIIKRS